MLNVNLFAETDFRNERRRFGIKRADRRLHMYVIGKTGTGKTSLLLNMALNDAHGGEGLTFLDPHGDAAESLLNAIPASRRKDVIHFNPADTDHPIPLNVLDQVPPERRHLLVSGVVSIFRKLYSEHWHHRQEHIMRNALYALLEAQERPTLIEVYRLLTDWRYRKRVAAAITDTVVKAFWDNEFPKYQYMNKGEALAPIQNKLGAFLTAPLVRGIIGQPESGFDFREVMDGGRIIVADLSKGRIGEDSAGFLGALLILKLQLAAMSRIDTPEEERRDHYLYIDEFQSFLGSAGLDTILSEARKYRLCLVMAHQYLGQLGERLEKAVLGNIGTVVAFAIGPENGEVLEKEFNPPFSRQDLIERERFQIYLRLAIDGRTSKPFSAVTLPPPPSGERPAGTITQVARQRSAQGKPSSRRRQITLW